MSKVVAEKVGVEKVKQKLVNGNSSPKKTKPTERKTSKVAKSEETKDKDKVNKPPSRSSSPRKKDIDKQQPDTRSCSRSNSPRKGQRKDKNHLDVVNGESRRSSSSKTEIIGNSEQNVGNLLNMCDDEDDEEDYDDSNGSSVSLHV